ncbi:hypothetical protein ACFWN2_22705 [Lentzea sp. NPDC058436]|uniref:hypothetical protein n=1 Tax=Lentzea sp. NPDC058436 TaxID=3346499 RepID=UPI00365FA0DA
MSGTPIFDELYAKYVIGAPATVTYPDVTVPREVWQEQVVPQFAASVDAPVWPS